MAVPPSIVTEPPLVELVASVVLLKLETPLTSSVPFNKVFKSTVKLA